MHITTLGRSLVVLMTLPAAQPQTAGCRLSCKQPWMADFATVAEGKKFLSESLEQLASYNGADMRKQNMLYINNMTAYFSTQKSPQ